MFNKILTAEYPSISDANTAIVDDTRVGLKVYRTSSSTINLPDSKWGMLIAVEAEQYCSQIFMAHDIEGCLYYRVKKNDYFSTWKPLSTIRSQSTDISSGSSLATDNVLLIYE